MDLYANIRKIALQKGYSIKSLEEKVGFANGTIRRWNTSSPSIDKVIKVADALNVKIETLTGRDDTSFHSHKYEETRNQFDTLAAHAADRQHEFTDDEIEHIKAYLDGIIDADQSAKREK